MTNPLLSDWDTPFDLPPFDDITDADFEPAMEAALADARANVAAIADSPDEPTFANTIEALEEADLNVTKLHYVSGHYPSPGAVTEFIYAYVAEADLSAKDGTVAGLASEAEDIRSHVISFGHFMRLVETGEVAAGPLVTSAYWLALNRARLRGDA